MHFCFLFNLALKLLNCYFTDVDRAEWEMEPLCIRVVEGGERNLTVQERGARRWPRGAAALRLGSATQQDLAGNGGLKLEAMSCIQKMDNISWILRWNF